MFHRLRIEDVKKAISTAPIDMVCDLTFFEPNSSRDTLFIQPIFNQTGPTLEQVNRYAEFLRSFFANQGISGRVNVDITDMPIPERFGTSNKTTAQSHLVRVSVM